MLQGCHTILFSKFPDYSWSNSTNFSAARPPISAKHLRIPISVCWRGISITTKGQFFNIIRSKFYWLCSHFPWLFLTDFFLTDFFLTFLTYTFVFTDFFLTFLTDFWFYWLNWHFFFVLFPDFPGLWHPQKRSYEQTGLDPSTVYNSFRYLQVCGEDGSCKAGIITSKSSIRVVRKVIVWAAPKGCRGQRRAVVLWWTQARCLHWGWRRWRARGWDPGARSPPRPPTRPRRPPPPPRDSWLTSTSPPPHSRRSACCNNTTFINKCAITKKTLRKALSTRP